MENLNEMGVVEITLTQQRKIDAGWFTLITPAGLTGTILGIKSILGAYQKGYDQAQNNCECEK